MSTTQERSTPARTEPSTDLAAAGGMMSPTTIALLADMNAGSRPVAASAGAERRPLGVVHGNRRDDAAGAGAGAAPPRKATRPMGPYESTYRTRHDAFVTRTIARHAARTSTNLRRDPLPDFRAMSRMERDEALQGADRLLARLALEVEGEGAGAGGRRRGSESESRAGGVGDRDAGRRAEASSAADGDDTFGSATTLGEGRERDETFGSATTLGESDREGSERRSAGSATVPGNDTSLASATAAGGREDRSVSLLENSMALLSEDEAGCGGDGGDDDEEEETRFSGREDGVGGKENSPRTMPRRVVAPIERTRHRQPDPPRGASLALDDDDMDMVGSTPPFATHKRPASNSGKRGLKSRHRSNDDEEDDSLLLGDFDGIGGCGGGMFLHDEEDAFSCGTSPIRPRFSCDYGLGSDRDEGGNDGSSRGGSPGREGVIAGANDGNESEGDDGRFSMQDDDDDVRFDDDNDGCYGDERDDGEGNGDGSGGPGRSASQRPGDRDRLSQWNAFRNADAELTHTQRDGDGDEDEDSPVRRRAIRFDGASQLPSQRRSQRRGDLARGGKVPNDAVDRDTTGEGRRGRRRGPETAGGADDDDDDDDPIQTVRNLCRRAKELEGRGDGMDTSLLEEVAPIDVRLRDGAHFRMDPLRCRQENDGARKSALKGKASKKRGTRTVTIARTGGRGRTNAAAEGSDSDNSLSDPEPSFKDPISDFPSRVAARLNAGLGFLVEKEAGAARGASEEGTEDVPGSASAVLLSMTVRQIMCVTSKLLLQTRKSTRGHQRSKNRMSTARRRRTPTTSGAPEGDNCLAGGTLIVLRGKEHIPQWEVALREYTSLSCVDHAGMPSTLRKLATTAGKCSGFDVVLTTYDAIKSKEVTVPVDDVGRAILGARGGGDGGWFTARGAGSTQPDGGASAPQKCHQLSVLHRMSWYRVIFMDVLGRKGFLTKPGTARAQAAVAINSKSRFAFFERDEAATSKAEAKFKDDRRQLRSIITALHLPERMKLDKLIGSYIVDVNQLGKGKDERDLLSSSSGDEYVSEDESDDGNLTEPW